MDDICIIYASENKLIVRKLVLFLSKYWIVWWDDKLPLGNWDQEVENRISGTKVVVAVVSSYTKNKPVFKDELDLAHRKGKIICPFFIEESELPIGHRRLTGTYALGWNGDVNHPSLKVLKEKITEAIGIETYGKCAVERKFRISIKEKNFLLPGFVFSLSSHETKVSPKDGVKLFKLLGPPAILVSAYDIWQYTRIKNNLEEEGIMFKKAIDELKKSSSILMLDSGNYEAYRKNDRFSENNQEGWCNDKYREIVSTFSSDIVFCYDSPDPEGEINKIADDIIQSYYRDKEAIGIKDIIFCPIIHLPKSFTRSSGKEAGRLAECAAQLALEIVSVLDPFMIAVPERELGCGIIEIVNSVRHIRGALNSLGRYYPLHLLGTGNPITMIALAAAGADSFDGLEWCRTVADYESGFLFHFQHFDFFKDLYASRLDSPIIRMLIENPEAPFATQVAVYNLDFFMDWTRTMQELTEAGKEEHLLKYIKVPNIGDRIFRGLATNES